MPIVMARVDQRLIHGITVNQWNTKLQPKRFMVVDDEISGNETLKASMRMSKPAGTGMSIISREKAVQNFNSGNYDNQRVFLIVKEPSILLDLMKGGVSIPEVNVGVIFNEDGRTPVTNRVALNKTELADLKAIEAQGISVKLQYTPDETPIVLDSAIKGKII